MVLVLLLTIIVLVDGSTDSTDRISLKDFQDAGWRSAMRCGPNALFITLCSHGHAVDVKDIYEHIEVSKLGCNLADIVQEASRQKISLQTAKTNLDGLRKIKLPAITHHDSMLGGVSGHFLVVLSLGESVPNSGEPAVLVIDPITLVKSHYSHVEFLRAWSGYVAFVGDRDPYLKYLDIVSMVFSAGSILFGALIFREFFRRKRMS